MVTPNRMESKQGKKKIEEVYLNITQYITDCTCVSEEENKV